MRKKHYRYDYMVEYRKKHPDYVKRCKAKVRKYQQARPWYFSYSSAKSRCTNPNVNCYQRYGGRGIKFLLTREEVAYLWGRDKADSMVQATLDRIDNEKNYELSNCRFIEKSLNSTKGNYEARWK